MSTVRADEMFFVYFYVADSQGAPLNGVEIKVTGLGYDDVVYTGSDGHAPRLALISDQRNAHYTWTASYQLKTENGDFYVPDNYNDIDITMSDVNVQTPTPSPTATLTPNPTPTGAPTPTPTPIATPKTNPTQAPTTSPTQQETDSTSTPSPTIQPTTTSSPSSSPIITPTIPANLSQLQLKDYLLPISVILTIAIVLSLLLFRRHQKTSSPN